MPLELELIWCVIILVGLIGISWFGGGSVGLSLAYFISLGFIHFWGGFIHALPWYHGGEADYTRTGFDEYTWAVTALAAGRLLLAPVISKRLPLSESAIAVSSLARISILIGAVLYGFLRVLLRGVPSISAVAQCGGALFVAGLCLFAWEGIRQKKPLYLISALAAVGCLPFFTIISSGFLGYGAGAALVVVAFLFCQMRSRVLAVVFLMFTVYIGFCTFMTYMRDRADIRDEMWEEESSFGERLQRLHTTFAKFETVNFYHQEQLERIEARLNQNDLVGRAVSTLDSGAVDFARGETFRQAVISVVPRIFWPDKPVTAGSPDIVSYFTGLFFAPGTSVGIGQVMEGYVNFGTAGVIGVCLVFGVVLGVVDVQAARKLKQNDTLGFIIWFVPGIGFLQPGGSLVEVGATVAASIVLVLTFRTPFAMRAKKATEEAGPRTFGVRNHYRPVGR